MTNLAFYYPENHENHFQQGHPERPDRVETINNALSNSGLAPYIHRLAPEHLTDDLLHTVHDSVYLKKLNAACKHGNNLDMDTYTTTDSCNIAMKTVGGALAVAHAVWEGSHESGFALTRPPGHHATRMRGMGFCLLNNVALAAQSLISAKGAERIAIVDLDLHHGNGTQDIFWERADVLYISSHQYPHYPGSGRLSETGSGLGEGATVNLPLPPGSGDRAFSVMTDTVILPILERFQPEVLLISAGFDVHWRDPLGSLEVSAYGFGQVVSKFVQWCDDYCDGRIALFLEGGYDLEAGAACALTATSALLGKSIEDSLGTSPYPEGTDWMNILDQVKQLWQLT
jgi:acetoin utilization deacetylase AcuC-like enzyme